MTRHLGYEMFKPSTRTSSRCTYLWIFLIFALVITVYQYRLRNYGSKEKVQMVHVPVKNVQVQHHQRMDDSAGREPLPMPLAEQASKGDEQVKGGANSKLSRSNSVPSFRHGSIASNNQSRVLPSERAGNVIAPKLFPNNSNEFGNSMPNISTPIALMSNSAELESNSTLRESVASSTSILNGTNLNDDVSSHSKSDILHGANANSTEITQSSITSSNESNLSLNATRMDNTTLGIGTLPNGSHRIENATLLEPTATLPLPNFNTEWAKIEPNPSRMNETVINSIQMVTQGLNSNRMVNLQQPTPSPISKRTESIAQSLHNPPRPELQNSERRLSGNSNSQIHNRP